MAFVMAAVSFVSVRLGREAERSRRREQRTQALLDLSRNLMRPRNAMGLVDVSLDAVERLFGRSAALYVRDPFDRRPDAERSKAAAVRAVEGDAGQGDFDRLTEHAVVHWVFSNATAAGNGTDTHEESYIFYLPLAARGNVVGVLGVSAKREPLEAAERSFLELVAGQVMLALERQELAARHVADVDRMRVAEVRETFYASVLASADVASDLVHDLMDVQLALGSDAVVYREALEEAVSDESARLRLMIDRLIPVLALQPEGPDCDVRAEVTRAVDEAREGLMGRVIDLEPGDPVPAVVADAQLVRLAVRFILDAAASYVPRGGMIRVSVRDHPDNVLVVVADDRPSELGSSHAAAFETSVREGGETVLVYDELRARGLYTALLDRACVTGDSDAYVASLCHALRLPEGVARGEGSVDALNRRRLMRYDRLEYGLYMAAQIVRAHGGSIRQRYRLGGGAVVSFTLPKE